MALGLADYFRLKLRSPDAACAVGTRFEGDDVAAGEPVVAPGTD